MSKKITIELEDYQVLALKGIAKQRKVSEDKLAQEAIDLLIAHYHYSKIEPSYTGEIDEFIAANRELLKGLFR